VDGIVDWYLLGLVIGLGVAAGIAADGAIRTRGSARAFWALLAAACVAGAIVIAILAVAWWAVLGTAVGVVVGWLAYRRLSADAVPAAALGALALAAIPVAGYVLLVVSPVVGQRLGRRADTRHAGLRILAKD
jgi:hypothetical protein